LSFHDSPRTHSQARSHALCDDVRFERRCTAKHDEARRPRPNKWLIAAGEQVPAFVFANGPAFVTHYNFKQPRGRKVDLKYLAINSHLPSRKSDMQDILTLTPAGVELSKRDPHAVVYEWEFACTGKSYYTTTAPNCTGLVVEAMAPAWRPAVVALTGTAAAASA